MLDDIFECFSVASRISNLIEFVLVKLNNIKKIFKKIKFNKIAFTKKNSSGKSGWDNSIS